MTTTENNLNANPGASIDNSGIIDVGGGWYRIFMTITVQTSGGGVDESGVDNLVIMFDRFNNASEELRETLWWGVQAEKSATLGRYIKTSGTAITAPTTVKNLSSSSYPSTISGAEFNSNGYFVFDNTYNDQIISSTTTIGDTNPAGLTAEIWVNCSSSGPFGEAQTGGQNWIFGEEQRYRIIWSDADEVTWVVRTTNNAWYSTGTVTTGTFNSQDTWTHIVGVYDGSNVRLYKNGSQVSFNASTISGNIDGSVADPTIGIMAHPGISGTGLGYGSGLVGEVRVYNRGLTATEVSQNFNATRSKYGV